MDQNNEESKKKYQFLAEPSDTTRGLTGKDVINCFPQTTTVHGVPHVANARGIIKKVCWILLAILCFGGLTFHLYSISRLFFKFGASVSISLEHEEELEFPAVTLCNMSPVRRSLWEAAHMGAGSLFSVPAQDNSTSPSTAHLRRKKRDLGCPTGYHLEGSGFCYKKVTTGMTWMNARQYCKDDEGFLAVSHSSSDQAAIMNVKESTEYWLGLKKRRTGIWTWDDGTIGYAGYNNWEAGMPNGYNCVKLRWDGWWAATRCEDIYPFVCQIGQICTTGDNCYYPEDCGVTLSDGLYQLCDSCDTFLSCYNSNGQYLLQDCVAGRAFDQNLRYCDWSSDGSSSTCTPCPIAESTTTEDVPTTTETAPTAPPSVPLLIPQNETCDCPCCNAANDLYKLTLSPNVSDSLKEEIPQYRADSIYPERPALREDFAQGEDLLETLAGLDGPSKKDLGYSIQDMIIDCQYAGSDCSFRRDFAEFNNPRHGNCFTFNSGWNRRIKTSKRSGPRHGLQVTVNIDQDDYIPEASDTAGLRIVVHSANTMPFPEDEGVTVNPGEATYVGVRKIHIHRLSGKYGNCRDPNERNIDANVYEEYFDVKYNQMSCMKTCHQKHVIERCGCADAYFPPEGTAFNNTRVPICSVQNTEHDDCKYAVRRLFEENELECDCPNSCNDVLYETTLSSGTWPSDVQKINLLSKYATKIDHLLTDTTDPLKYARNLLKVHIYYEEFNYENVQEKIAYPAGAFVSDVGGVLGLWFGCSILTIAEFIEFFSDLSVLRCRKKSNRKVEDSERAGPILATGKCPPGKLEPIEKKTHSPKRNNKTEGNSSNVERDGRETVMSSAPPSYETLIQSEKSHNGKKSSSSKKSKRKNADNKRTRTPVEKFTS